MMRITAGKFRQKQVKTIDSKNIRPSLSKTRESIFNILQNQTEGTVWLDLFAGSGIIGLEAASRGAQKIIFVEKNPGHFKLLKENLSQFEFEYEAYLKDAIKALDYFKEDQFDFIFLDPPYKSDLAESALKIIVSKKLLNSNGIIIIECPKDKEFEDLTKELNLTIRTQKLYGDTKLYFISI
ncbi:MAG: 16S rRNA (guanine(966)-N(2))-methyltransferase RsmD [Candidatus Gastranaerophilales bacterium]|nr:16S rRNA (guanine(966)-N(2))-methyltransferase RsmD [Candidatus Gastranaerophilales bacterium]